MAPRAYLPGTASYNHPPIPQLRFTDPAELNALIDSYFDSVSKRVPANPGKPDGPQTIEWLQPPNMIDLATFIGCDYKLLYNIQDGLYRGNPQITEEQCEGLMQALSRARQICHGYTVRSVYTAKSAQGPIFVLKSVYGYQDVTTIQAKHTVEDSRMDLTQLSDQELEQYQKLLAKAMSKQIADNNSAPVGLLDTAIRTATPEAQVVDDDNDDTD